MIKNIAIVTGTRAEYGILKPLIKKVAESKDFELHLFVTGLHLLEKYGYTINEIRGDGIDIDFTVDMYDDSEKMTNYGEALGRGIMGFTSALSQFPIDLVIVLGDRLEPFAAVLAAATLGLPIAHIHGGDKTDSGHIDEQIRHSISRFSHIHFTATKEHADRLLKFGEEPWRIYNVGALGLDSIMDETILSKVELSRKYGIQLHDRYIVCLFHPISTEPELAGHQMNEILNAIIKEGIQAVIIYPNNDHGSQNIICEIEKRRNISEFIVFKNLEHQDYVALLKHSKALIGNSSSGIIEAPSLKIPVINVGKRNFGRDHADNVLFVEANRDMISEAIKYALYDSNFKKRLNSISNPYGEGGTSDKILDTLQKLSIGKEFMRKKVTY